MSSRARPCGHKRQRSSNDIDRISDLPKSVLCHILSFFPTEDAVATSFLSTRWKFLWTNIHNLSFIESICSRFFWRNIKDRKIKFAHFINKVLLFLNGQSIDKFCLEIEEYCELYDATTWIATAVARKLKVLEFCLSVSDPSDPHIQFPCSLFTCKMLEVLVLRCDVSLNVPSLVCLPNLKTLHLEGVSYQCDESVRKLISGLSSLETLYIERDVYDNVVTFTISSPTLRNLTFTFDEPMSHFPEDIDYKLEINAPALRYLDLSDRMSRDFSVANLCSLHEANVRTNVIKDEANVPLIDYDHYSRAVVKLLQGVYNVKHLLLGDDTLEYFDHKDAHVRCWNEPKKVPICFLSCFQSMSIYRFKGLEDELAMVAYILKNAKVLRTMTIEAAYHRDVEAKFQLLKKVSKFFRGSEECEITFS